MLKRIMALLVALMMLCGMLQGVSASETADPYEYFPRDITLVSKTGNEGVVVAWKNPTSSLLSKVTVSNVSDGVEIGVVNTPTPGQISRVYQDTTEAVDYGICTVKLVFEFTDGEKREIYYSNDKRGYNLTTTQTAGKVSISNLNDWNIFTTNSQNATTGGKNSLMVISNINPETDFNNKSAQIFFNRLATGSAASFTVAGSLKNSTRYNFEYKVKTSDALTLNNYVNAAGETIFESGASAALNADSDWQTVSGSFTTNDNISTNGYVFFAINFKQATNKPFYIDDVKLTEMTGNETDGYTEYTGADTSSYTFDMEDVTDTPAKPTITASAGDASATFAGWTKADGFINVYEVIDGTRVLRARMNRNGSDTSVSIPYLTNNKLYKFEVTAMTKKGLESEAAVSELTPMAPVPDVAPVKYEYEPGNIMITDWRSGTTWASGIGGASMLSWKNPTSEKLSTVKVYRIADDGTETEVTASAKAHFGTESAFTSLATPGAVGRLSETHAVASGKVKYRLVFTFTDGEVRDVIYADDWDAGAGLQLTSAESPKKGVAKYSFMSYGPEGDRNGASAATMDSVGQITVSSKEAATGVASLKIATNAWAMGYDSVNSKWVSMDNDYVNADENAGLTANTAYKITMKINTIEEAKLLIGKTLVTLPNTNGNWREVTYDFTASNANLVFKTKGSAGEVREIYIDDVTIYDTTGQTALYSEDYERSAISTLREAPEGVTAAAGNEQTTISWTATEDGYVNVYEVTEDGYEMLRAHVPASDMSVALTSLENDKEYTFKVKGARANNINYAGFESEAATVTVVPTYVAEVADQYEYEPGNIMVTDWRSGTTWASGIGGASMLSWKNPTSEKLSTVKVYRIADDGTETEVTASAKAHFGTESAFTSLATPGAVGRLSETHVTASGRVKYRLVFTFTDGEVRDVIYADDWDASAGLELLLTESPKKSVAKYDFMSYGPEGDRNGASAATMGSVGQITVSSKEAATGVASLKIATNAWAMGYDSVNSKWVSMDNDYVNADENAGLTANTAYKITMKINTIEEAKLNIGKTLITLPNTNGSWTEVTYDFAASNANLVFKTKGSAGEVREIYIDDVTIYDTTGQTALYSEDYERSAISTLRQAPEGVTAISGQKSMTTISWTATQDGYVNVYEVTEDGYEMLRAHVPATDMSVALTSLENDKEYTFKVKGVRANNINYAGFESEAATVTAVPTAPDYEITGVKLLSGSTPAETIAAGGTYSATATIINNKVALGVKAQVIVAVYADGVLEDCFVSTAETVDEGATKILTVPAVTVGNDAEAEYTAKLMIWKDLGSAIPLIPSVDFAEAVQ